MTDLSRAIAKLAVERTDSPSEARRALADAITILLHDKSAKLTQTATYMIQTLDGGLSALDSLERAGVFKTAPRQ